MRLRLKELALDWVYAAFAAIVLAGAGVSLAIAAPRAKRVRSSAEYAVSNRATLASLEVDLSDATASEGQRLPVTDMALYVSRAGADLRQVLTAADGEVLSGAPGGERGPQPALFNVRVFVVAGGRLFTGARGKCGTWSNDVSRCTAGCDGGTFALRRKGSAPLELLLGAVPGGEAGSGQGLVLTGCQADDLTEARLVAKAGRGLAVVGFDE